MSETLGTYYFNVAPSADGIGKELKDTLSDAGQQGGSSFSASFGKVLGTSGAIIGGITTAVGALGTGFINAATDVASYGDNIDKMSQKMGISATAYQEWEAVMQHSGTSMETLKASMKTLSTAAESNTEAFAALGISEEQLATLSQEDLFSTVITQLQGMEEGTERTYLAGQLLGRGATELGALLNTSAEETQAMKDRVHELGGVLSGDAVTAAAGFQDQLQDMQTSAQGLVNNLMSEFLPSITEVMGGLTDIFSGDYASGLNGISNGINHIVDEISAKLPEVMKIGTRIILSLGKAIVSSAPDLISAGMDVIKELALGLTQALPTILDTVVEIITTVIDSLTTTLPTLLPKVLEAVITLITSLIGHLPEILASLLELVKAIADSLLTDVLPMLIQALPGIILGIVNFIIESIPQIIAAVIDIITAIVEAFPTIIATLVEAIPEIIVGIITALLTSIPQLVSAGIELFISLITALPQIIIEIVKAIPEIITGIVDGFKENWPAIKQAGKDLLTELGGGLKNVGSTIKTAVTTVWNAIKNAFSAYFSKMKEIGKNILQGLLDGITSMVSKVKETVTKVASSVADAFKSFFGISSPSKLFKEYGQFIDEGLAEGIESGEKVVSSAMDDLNNSVVGDIKANSSVMYDSGYNTRTVSTSSGEKDLYTLLATYLPYLADKNNTNITLEGDAEALFKIIQRQSKSYKIQTGNPAFA